MVIKKMNKIFLKGILLFALVANLFYWGSRKEGYFCDEMYSYHYTNRVDAPYITIDGEETWQETWHDSDFFRGYLTMSKDETFDIKGVLKSIEQDPHPPVFYILMELSCSAFSIFFPGVFSKWCGIAVNIFFFVLAIIVLYKLSKEILQSDFWAISVCALYGFSAGAVSTVVFIRMYMIYTFFALLFAYVNAILWKKIWDEKKDTNNGAFFALFVTAILGILTQYYFFIYAFFICITVWGYSLWAKKYRFAVKYALTMAAGLICSYFIYPVMRHDLFSGMRGTEAFQNFKDKSDWKSSFGEFIAIVNAELFGNAGGLILIALIVMAVGGLVLLQWNVKKSVTVQKGVCIALERKEKKQSLEFHLDIHDMIFIQILFAVLFYMILMAKIAPYQEDRYIFNVFPQIILIVVYIFKKLFTVLRSGHRLEIFGVIVLLIFTGVGYLSTGVNYLYKGTEEKLQTTSNYSNLPIFYINYGSNYRACAESVYFAKAQFTYPAREENIGGFSAALDELKIRGEIDTVNCLVYIDLGCSDTNGIIKQVQEELKSGKARWLFDTEYSAVYIIE